MYVCLSDASDGASHYNCFLATRFTRGHCISPSCSLHAPVAHICRWVMTAGLTGVISIRVLAEWSVVVLSANARNSSEGSSMQAVWAALIGSCRWNVRGQLGIPAAQPWHNEKYNENNLWLTGIVEYSIDCASCPPVCMPSPYLASRHSTAQCILGSSSTLHSNHSILHLGHKDMLILHSTVQCILGSNCTFHSHHSILHLGYRDKLQGGRVSSYWLNRQTLWEEATNTSTTNLLQITLWCT